MTHKLVSKCFEGDVWRLILSFLVQGSHDVIEPQDDNEILVTLIRVNHQWARNIHICLPLFIIRFTFFTETCSFPAANGYNQAKNINFFIETLRLSVEQADWLQQRAANGYNRVKKLTLDFPTLPQSLFRFNISEHFLDLNSLVLTGKCSLGTLNEPLTLLTSLQTLGMYINTPYFVYIPPNLKRLHIFDRRFKSTVNDVIHYRGTLPFCSKLESLSIHVENSMNFRTNIYELVPQLTTLEITIAGGIMPILFQSCKNMTNLQTLKLVEKFSRATVLSSNSSLENIHLLEPGEPFGKAEPMFRNLTSLYFSDLAMTEEWYDATCRALSNLVTLDIVCLDDEPDWIPKCILRLRPYYARVSGEKDWCFPIISEIYSHHFTSLRCLTFHMQHCVNYIPCSVMTQTSFMQLPRLETLVFVSETTKVFTRDSKMSFEDSAVCPECHLVHQLRAAANFASLCVEK